MKTPSIHWRSALTWGLLGWACAFNSLADEPNLSYVVRPGESIYQIAEQHLIPGRSWQDLASENRLSKPQLIQVGQRLQIPIGWLAAKPAAVTLLSLSGDVQIGASKTGWHAAQQGERIQTGQQIKLGSNSIATLGFADGSELTLQPNTRLELDTLSIYAGGYMSDTRLRLQSGRVEVRANPKGLKNQRLDVITPSAVTAVRGTQFLIEAQERRMLTQTSEGKVQLQNEQGAEMVLAGYGSIAKDGERPSEPIAIKPAPVLDQAAHRWTDFPIQFNALQQAQVDAWVVQAVRGDEKQMRALATEIRTVVPSFDLGALENGTYQLRTWSVDEQGMPSKIALHPFQVDIPRTLKESPSTIRASLMSKGVRLVLEPPPQGQRYLLELTTDAQGRHKVWYAHNARQNTTLPQQLQPSADHYYLWIWVY